MGLSIRMALYFVFSFLASQGVVMFDQAQGTVTFQIEHVVTVLSGIGGFAATFWASRIAKNKGGST